MAAILSRLCIRKMEVLVRHDGSSLVHNFPARELLRSQPCSYKGPPPSPHVVKTAHYGNQAIASLVRSSTLFSALMSLRLRAGSSGT